MSIKVEKKNIGSGYFTIVFSGHVRVYKVYKKNLDGSFVDLYGGIFEANNSSIRINMTNYDSLIVVYDKIDQLGVVSINDFSKTFSYFYTFSFKKTEIKNKKVVVDIEFENPGNLNISASIAVTSNGITDTFEYPISGEYVASSSESIGIPVSNNMFTMTDHTNNQNYSIYIPEKIKNTESFEFNRNTIINKTNSLMSIFVELKIFSISGNMDIAPIIRAARVIYDDNK
jgi:hypothetical protein